MAVIGLFSLNISEMGNTDNSGSHITFRKKGIASTINTNVKVAKEKAITEAMERAIKHYEDTLKSHCKLGSKAILFQDIYYGIQSSKAGNHFTNFKVIETSQNEGY